MTPAVRPVSTPQATDWNGAFRIEGPHAPAIELRQIQPTTFALGDVRITYTGDTGLDRFVGSSSFDADMADMIRTVDQRLLPTTDLASVPRALRWFSNTYGAHTPAALIHDFLIVDKRVEPVVPPWMADRYFRFMLAGLGVPLLKRNIMWSAVALRTRVTTSVFHAVLVAVWALLAVCGLLAFGVSVWALLSNGPDLVGVAPEIVLALSVAAPLVASLLWSRQAGAGLIAAAAAPFLLPAAAVASVGYGLYALAERAARIVDQ